MRKVLGDARQLLHPFAMRVERAVGGEKLANSQLLHVGHQIFSSGFCFMSIKKRVELIAKFCELLQKHWKNVQGKVHYLPQILTNPKSAMVSCKKRKL